MKKLLLAILFVVPASFASAECTNEWSIEPTAEYDSLDDYATVGINFVFSFGGSVVAECEAAVAERRSEEARRKHEDARREEQELTNQMAKLRLCNEALKLNAPGIIANCRAEGYIE